jgi:hypothetical protein
MSNPEESETPEGTGAAGEPAAQTGGATGSHGDAQAHDRKPLRRNYFLIAVLLAIPVALFLGVKIGGEGKLAGSRLALQCVATAIAYGVLYMVIVIVREASFGKAVPVSVLGGKAEPRPDADPNVAQHEALTTQAKATEAIAHATTEQLAQQTELLKQERQRADRETERANRLQRQLEASRQTRPHPGGGGGGGGGLPEPRHEDERLG